MSPILLRQMLLSQNSHGRRNVHLFVLGSVNSLDEETDLKQICPAQIWCKHTFAPEQTRSKRSKCHICYHIYTCANMVANVAFTTFATGLLWSKLIWLHHICAVQIWCKPIFASSGWPNWNITTSLSCQCFTRLNDFLEINCQLKQANYNPIFKTFEQATGTMILLVYVGSMVI